MTSVPKKAFLAAGQNAAHEPLTNMLPPNADVHLRQINYLANELSLVLRLTFHTLTDQKYRSRPAFYGVGFNYGGAVGLQIAACAPEDLEGTHQPPTIDVEFDRDLAKFFNILKDAASGMGGVDIDMIQHLPAYTVRAESPIEMIALLEVFIRINSLKTIDMAGATQQKAKYHSAAYFADFAEQHRAAGQKQGRDSDALEKDVLYAMPMRSYAEKAGAYTHGALSHENRFVMNISLARLRVLAQELLYTSAALTPEDTVYRMH